MFTWLEEKEYNIYCLQETHSTNLDEVGQKKDWGGEYICVMGRKTQKG
jgi:hypothetical protein